MRLEQNSMTGMATGYAADLDAEFFLLSLRGLFKNVHVLIFLYVEQCVILFWIPSLATER
jgi:hypothetical protein